MIQILKIPNTLKIIEIMALPSSFNSESKRIDFFGNQIEINKQELAGFLGI